MIFIVWNLLAVRPVFFATELHQNENLKKGIRGERGREGETDRPDP